MVCLFCVTAGKRHVELEKKYAPGYYLTAQEIAEVKGLHEVCPDYGMSQPTRCDCQHRTDNSRKESAIN